MGKVASSCATKSSFIVGFAFVVITLGYTNATSASDDQPGRQSHGEKYDDQLPLTQLDWIDPSLFGDGNSLGTFKLPLSAARSNVMTEARVEIRYFSATFPYVEVAFSFPDPKPYGIPFTFQKIELDWNSKQALGSQILDWSRGDASPGRSLFPGQSFRIQIPMSGFTSDQTPDALRILIWGSRN